MRDLPWTRADTRTWATRKTWDGQAGPVVTAAHLHDVAAAIGRGVVVAADIVVATGLAAAQVDVALQQLRKAGIITYNRPVRKWMSAAPASSSYVGEHNGLPEVSRG